MEEDCIVYKITPLKEENNPIFKLMIYSVDKYTRDTQQGLRIMNRRVADRLSATKAPGINQLRRS